MLEVSKFVLQPWLAPTLPAVVQTSTGETSDGPTVVPKPGEPVPTTVSVPQDVIATPLWNRPSQLSLDIFISTTPMPGEVLDVNVGPDVNLAHLTWKDIQWGDWTVERDWTGDIPLPSVSVFSYLHFSPGLEAISEAMLMNMLPTALYRALRKMTRLSGRIYSWLLTALITCHMVKGSSLAKFIM